MGEEPGGAGVVWVRDDEGLVGAMVEGVEGGSLFGLGLVCQLWLWRCFDWGRSV